MPGTAETTLARVLGGPEKYQMQYTVPVELSDEGQQRVVDAVRRVTGHHGKVEEVMGSLEWQTVGELSVIHVTVRPGDGRTTLSVIAERGPAGLLQLGLPMIAGLIGIGITGAIIEPTSAAGVIGVVAGSLGTAFITARTIWATTTKSFRIKLRDLMGAASRTADESAKVSNTGIDRPSNPDT